MRTTLDIDDSVLAELRVRQRDEGKSLGRLASELLARALGDTTVAQSLEPLRWTAQPMRAYVDLEDADAVAAVLDANP